MTFTLRSLDKQAQYAEKYIIFGIFNVVSISVPFVFLLNIPAVLNRYKIFEILFRISDYFKFWSDLEWGTKMTRDFQTLHLFDDIHSNENKKYSFHIELVSKGTRLK